MPGSISYSSDPSIELFEQWLDAHQIKRHPGVSMVPMTHSSGFRVISTAPIPIGTVICAVPKRSIFSHKTASLDIPALAKEPERSADIIYRLTAYLLHELRLGKDSAWYGWLQVLPRETVQVPILWDDPEVGGEDGRAGLEWLGGTEAEREMKTQTRDGLTKVCPLHEDCFRADRQESLQTFFAELQLPPTPSYPTPPTYADFLYVFSLVSSRGFMLDAYHQIGIPPFCDMFNHSTESAQTSLLCDAAVCPECGSLQRCEHDDCDEEEKPHRLRKFKTAYLEKMKANGEDEQVDMRAELAIAAGAEVFSCYEEDLTSAKALVGYGFFNPEPTVSRVSFDANALINMDNIINMSRVTGYGRVEDRLFGLGQEEHVKGRHLFKPSGEPFFGMDGDGTMSINIFFALHIQASADHGFHYHSLEMRERAILRDEEILRLAAVADVPRQLDCKGSVLLHILRRIVQMLEEHLEGMYRPDLAPEDIDKEMLRLPASAILQRQAMTFTMDERRLLHRELERWKVLLGDQGRGERWCRSERPLAFSNPCKYWSQVKLIRPDDE